MSKNINGEIYRYTHIPTNRHYIGLSTTTHKDRRKEHEKGKTGSYINRAIQKYGMEEFTFSLLHTGITDWRILNELEIALIDSHDSYHNGFNEHTGGQAEYRRDPAWDSAEEIAGMYTVREMSAYEIGRRFDASASVIYHILDSLNIPRRTNGWWLKDKPSWNRCKSWDHAEEIGRMYIIEKKSVRQIAKHFKTNKSTIYGILDSLDIPRRGNGWWTKGVPSPNRSHAWDHAEEIAEMYDNQKMTAYQISKHFDNVGTGVIYKILDAQDIVRRTHQREEVWQQAEEIVRMYEKEEMTLTAIAQCFDTNPTLIRTILQSRGVRLRGNKKVEVWDQAEEIAHMYEVETLSTQEIADHFGVTRTTINTVLKSIGITLRTGRKSQLLRLERERLKWQLTFEFA